MPLPDTVLYPPFNIVRLSHMELQVTDLDWARGFYVDTFGLQVTFEDSNSIYLRAMEERGHHCIILQKSDKPGVNVLGFKLFDEPELDKAAQWLESQGLPVSWVERPFMGKILRTRDPMGIPWNFLCAWIFLSPFTRSTSFITA